MLIYLDHAMKLNSRQSSVRCCTISTIEFMAIEVLWNIDHTYQRDFELFFYVLIWQCACRGCGEKWPNDTLLTNWYTRTYQKIAHKQGDIGVDWFPPVSNHFAGNGEESYFHIGMDPLSEHQRTQRFCMSQLSKLLTRLLIMSKTLNSSCVSLTLCPMATIIPYTMIMCLNFTFLIIFLRFALSSKCCQCDICLFFY